MYLSIKSCVKIDKNTITDLFSCNKGIRHGDGLSSVLFSLFINDTAILQGKQLSGSNTGNSLFELSNVRR